MKFHDFACLSAMALGGVLLSVQVAFAAPEPGRQGGVLMLSHESAGIQAQLAVADDHAGERGSNAAAHENHSAGDADGHGHSHSHEDQGKGGAHGGDHGEHEHDESGKHDFHNDDDDHAHGNAVRLTAEQLREFKIAVEPVSPGPIAVTITRPAEVSYNMDRFVHVVPRVMGIAVSVNATQGDVVEAGQALARLESRELAELKAAYLAAIERLDLAKDNFEREKVLKEKAITSEKSFLASRSIYAEARIALRSAKQKLHALGIDSGRLDEIVNVPDADLTGFVLFAPMGGVVVERHLVQGEAVPSDREAFVIADVSSVWVNISIYSHDLAQVAAGQGVIIKSETGLTANGRIEHVTPGVSEQTRTATARVILDTPSRRFRPGMFVNATIDVTQTRVAARVPKSALYIENGKEVVFVAKDGVFRPRQLTIGRRNEYFVEVISGLEPGERIATQGSFVIKSQLSKESFGDGHNH